MAIINVLKRMKYNETLSYGHLVNTAIIFVSTKRAPIQVKLSLNLL